MVSRQIQFFNGINADSVKYPFQAPSDVELENAPQSSYRFCCQYKCEDMFQYLMRNYGAEDLRDIIKKYVRYLRSTSGFRKADMSLLIVTYMMLLLLNDEQEEYKRMVSILSCTSSPWHVGPRWPTLDSINDAESLILLTQEVFGKVEWPAIRPLFNVNPLSPLVCINLLPSNTCSEVRFKILKSRPTDPRLRYFLFWYRLKIIPPEYSTFISNNQSRISNMLSIGNDQLKEQINSDGLFSSSPVKSMCLFEHFWSKVHKQSAAQSQTLKQPVSNFQTNEETSNNLSPIQESSANTPSNEPNLGSNQILKLSAKDLEISTFHGINMTLNQHYNLGMAFGYSAYPIDKDLLLFDEQVNTLIIGRIDNNEDLKPHVLQIVEAIVDPDNWTRRYGAAMYTVSAERVRSFFFSNKLKDDGIESLDITLPLKCPMTMMRLKIPVRGSSCKHISCFDHSSLALLWKNAQGFFRCPNCNKNLSKADIVVQDILNKTGADVDEVTIDSKTGKWRVRARNSEILESGEEQLMPKIPRMDESFIPDDLNTLNRYPPGSTITNAIVLD